MICVCACAQVCGSHVRVCVLNCFAMHFRDLICFFCLVLNDEISLHYI